MQCQQADGKQGSEDGETDTQARHGRPRHPAREQADQDGGDQRRGGEEDGQLLHHATPSRPSGLFIRSNWRCIEDLA